TAAPLPGPAADQGRERGVGQPEPRGGAVLVVHPPRRQRLHQLGDAELDGRRGRTGHGSARAPDASTTTVRTASSRPCGPGCSCTTESTSLACSTVSGAAPAGASTSPHPRPLTRNGSATPAVASATVAPGRNPATTCSIGPASGGSSSS